MLSRRLPVGIRGRFPVGRRLPVMLDRLPPIGLSGRLPVGQVHRWWLYGRLLWLLQLLAVLRLGGGSGTT